MSATARNPVRHGLIWSLSSRVGTQAIQFGIGVVLARILSPSEFGTIGMLLVFAGFAQLIADSGLGSALIHKKDVEEADRSTVFWIQAGIGAIMTLAFLAVAGPIADFFEDPPLKPLAQMMSAVFLIQALGLVHATLLRRAFRFGYLAAASIIASVTSGLIAVAMAAMGYGVWALLWQVLLSNLFTTLLSWSGYRWIPHFLFNKRSARELGSYGIYMLGYSSLNYWLRNGDNLLIGRFLGSFDLGLYSRAYSLMLLPINNIASVFGQVMFPALARLQDDAEAFRTLFLKAVRLIAFASFPMMTGVFLLSRQIVLILFGMKWAAMIPILQILSLAGIYQASIYPVGWIYSALGRTREQFLLSIVLAVAFAGAMAIGLRHGLIGVTLGYALWTMLSAVLNVYFAARIIGMPVFRMLAAVGRITLATIVMALVVFVVDRTWGPDAPLLASAFVCTATGVVTYLLVCRLLGEETLQVAGPYLARFRARTA